MYLVTGILLFALSEANSLKFLNTDMPKSEIFIKANETRITLHNGQSLINNIKIYRLVSTNNSTSFRLNPPGPSDRP